MYPPVNGCFLGDCYRITPFWKLKEVKADCEVGNCISSPALWNTYFSELQCLHRPNYGKSSQVIFVKPEIIDESLVSDSLMSCDPSIEHSKERHASAAPAIVIMC